MATASETTCRGCGARVYWTGRRWAALDLGASGDVCPSGLDDVENDHKPAGPCDWFLLSYYTDPSRSGRPEHRYCVCGWTEAHHVEKVLTP